MHNGVHKRLHCRKTCGQCEPSTTETSTTEPYTTEPYTTEPYTTASGTCRDFAHKQICENLNSTNNCTGVWKEFYCQLTCGKCSAAPIPSTNCSDEAPALVCHHLRLKNQCDMHNGVYKRLYCRKTCGQCEPSATEPSTTEPSTTAPGICRDFAYKKTCEHLRSIDKCNGVWKDHLCQLTCGKCSAGGVWGPWTNWTECSKTCGKGVQFKARACYVPPCSGANYTYRYCNVFPCQNQGYWGPWSVWYPCHRTQCNVAHGYKKRNRTCLYTLSVAGLPKILCNGSSVEKKPCNNAPQCDHPGAWDDWSKWSNCSKSCHYGIKTRKRTCKYGPYVGPVTMTGCHGPREEYSKCNLNVPCKYYGHWSPWGAWYPCNKTCHGGSRYKERQCVYYKHVVPFKLISCKGESRIYEPCHQNVPCHIYGSWKNWTTWSTCHGTCGQGVKFRVRSCQYLTSSGPIIKHQCKGDSIEYGHCDTNIQCPTTTPPATAPHGCIDMKPFHCQNRKNECHRNLFITFYFCKKTCGVCGGPASTTKPTQNPVDNCYDRIANCQYYKHNNDCESNMYIRKLHCPKTCGYCTSPTTSPPTIAPHNCSDRLSNHSCSAIKSRHSCTGMYKNYFCRLTCGACVPPNGFSDWSNWTKCTKTCGKGKTYRTRVCLVGPCSGPTVEYTKCNDISCNGLPYCKDSEGNSYRVGQTFIYPVCRGRCICLPDGSHHCVSLCLPQPPITCPPNQQLESYQVVVNGSSCLCTRKRCKPVAVPPSTCRDMLPHNECSKFLTKSTYCLASFFASFCQKTCGRCGVTSAPPTQPPCEDNENSFLCQQIQFYGHCQNDTFKYFKCRKTCGCNVLPPVTTTSPASTTTTPGVPCKDYYSTHNCTLARSKNFCDYYDYKSYFCRRTCGGCVPTPAPTTDSPPVCKDKLGSAVCSLVKMLKSLNGASYCEMDDYKHYLCVKSCSGCVPTPTTTAPECKDKIGEDICTKMSSASNDLCSTHGQYCRKSCKMCNSSTEPTTPSATTTAPPVCEDYYGLSNCTMAKKYGFCQYSHYKKFLCKRTCGICVPTPTTSPKCEDKIPKDLCDEILKKSRCSKSDLGDYCKKSCGICDSTTTSTKPPSCKNKERDIICHTLKEFGHCSYPHIKYQNCRKTCGCHVLPSGTTTTPPATTKAPPVCEDYYGTYNCTKAKMNRNCTQPHYKDYLCKLTCGTCVAPECKDEMKCDLVTRYGLCSAYGYFCRKSCGKCVPTPTTTAPECKDIIGKDICTTMYNNGQCSQHGQYCRNSCNMCNSSTDPTTPPDTTTSPKCQDKLPKDLCDKMLKISQCSKLGRYCKKSCGICVSTTTSTTTPSCKNKERDNICHLLKEYGHCTNPVIKNINCRKTCGCHDTGPTTPPATTTAPPVCEDFNGAANCTKARQYGLCRFPHFKQELCQRTCGNCVPPPTTNAPGCHDKLPKNICIAVRLRNECYIYEKDYCKKSCGKCDPSTTPSTTTAQTPPNNCHDKISNCHSKDCSNRLYKTTLCRLTCGGCYLPSW